MSHARICQISSLLRLLANRYVSSSLSEVRILGDERVSKAVIYLKSTEGIEINSHQVSTTKSYIWSTIFSHSPEIKGFLSICASLIKMTT